MIFQESYSENERAHNQDVWEFKNYISGSVQEFDKVGLITSMV